ncbi:olfactory receptor 10A4 [Alligator mississippiensis]|uniref:Olfactory receptor n=1 Tax=Alligator mississippiensis TaxID=8496 RepID=A0A151NU81_ALLMI|nr:olfactory receptor 10A4 [Alligator mississippiensis]KYO40338.1 olfactory receptor 10A4-like [Alligator mississippiensis]
MEENLTKVTEFIFLGFSDLQRLQLLLFVFVLLIYLIILIGNSLIIAVTVADIKLHTPMYFFLRNLSALEICYTTVTVPKILSDFLSERHTISFLGCVAQMYFFILFGVSECCLLVVMCYDRYAAICNPMRYPLIMNRKVCARMAAVVWTVGNVVACEQVAAIFSLPFHGSNVINHFFCDVLPVLRLASTETSLNELITTMLSVVLILIPFLLIIASYIRIMSTVLKMHSAEGRHKAFSTCSSHLISVTLFYGSTLVTYLRPSSEGSTNTDRALSLFYTVVTPTFNPIIYSLRNKEVKTALKKLVGRSIGLQVS